ncbi:MAG: non-hydrolyzing UDP-N-acetylglucosamine 2-epimerase [Campylobacter sp.]
MKKILIVFGTRPEAIKMVPLIKEFKKYNDFEVKICVSAQHRQMLDQVLNLFEIKPDYDLDIMKANQDLYDISSRVLLGMREILKVFCPNVVLVHGDTTTSFVGALAAFYQKIKIGHVEAGLRTNDLYSPFPEEANRQITGVLADFHFAPTQSAKQNLIKEGKNSNSIIVTGNTVIDALFLMIDKIEKNVNLRDEITSILRSKYSNFGSERKFILVTGHRRENFGDGFLNICDALKNIAQNNPEIDIVYPVHLNPNVQKPVREILSNLSNVYLIDPLEYEKFVYLMSKSFFIITDSGGIQEEAPSFGKPVLVTRDTTERPEALQSGAVKLVGTNKNIIIKEAQNLILQKDEFEKMSKANNPYGDGKASERIVEFLKERV